MFKLYDYKSFCEWYRAANKIAENEFNDCRSNIKSKFIPLAIERNFSDKYLIFTDSEAGTCGSAILTPLAFTILNEDSHLELMIKAGTWVLKEVHFHIENENPIQENHREFSRVIEEFHLGLFKELWKISCQERNSIALVFDPIADCEYESLHENLKFFGGFKFSKRIIEETDESCVALGVLSLTKDTYNCYLTKENLHKQLFECA